MKYLFSLILLFSVVACTDVDSDIVALDSDVVSRSIETNSPQAIGEWQACLLACYIEDQESPSGNQDPKDSIDACLQFCGPLFSMEYDDSAFEAALAGEGVAANETQSITRYIACLANCMASVIADYPPDSYEYQSQLSNCMSECSSVF